MKVDCELGKINPMMKKNPCRTYFKWKKWNNKRYDGDSLSHLFDWEIDDAEVVEMYKKILKFIFLPSTILFGVRLNYGWKPQRHFMMWFTLCNLAFAWFCFLYTQYVHIMSENDKMKIFEVFAVYGLGLSVTMRRFLFCMFK